MGHLTNKLNRFKQKSYQYLRMGAIWKKRMRSLRIHLRVETGFWLLSLSIRYHLVYGAYVLR